MKGYISIGQESHGPAQTVTKWFPVIPSGHEHCDVCSAIRPRDELEYVHSYDDGYPIYVCPEHL